MTQSTCSLNQNTCISNTLCSATPTSPNDQLCISCVENLSLSIDCNCRDGTPYEGCQICQNSTCSQCRKGYFAYGDICQACSSGCTDCDNSSCKACSDGLVPIDVFCAPTQCRNKADCRNEKLFCIEGKCRQCSVACATCDSDMYCDRCTPGFYLSILGKCVQTCFQHPLQGQFCDDGTVKSCYSGQQRQCECGEADNCEFCNSDFSQCSYCLIGFKMQSDKCVQCADGYKKIGTLCLKTHDIDIQAKSGMSIGFIIGIVMAILCGVLGVLGVMVFLYFQKKKGLVGEGYHQ
ncbi:Cysteine-rich membrane protein 2 [Spironucleus salmonicida]|uniref:Cysteine-rich membrane protein 2 n=1 Tax=Spironucleus salmonicida TaxID=348837 RepID=V6LT37_9EUKA|nr:Cysteine-rich membrane protein 2 [Spironucleus salmonicida]|eukprot:EST47812.1 Cysteine-rich membrane protein 2 [Spironucleus salmonicida]